MELEQWHGNNNGASDNLSWNCGSEGDDGVPEAVIALRKRQAKTFFCLLFLANGCLCCRWGQFLQTQRGNNNPYNQDNETTWLDWSRKGLHADHLRFVKRIIAFRTVHRASAASLWRDDVRCVGVGPSVDLSFRHGRASPIACTEDRTTTATST